jgi:hypothetical protein
MLSAFESKRPYGTVPDPWTLTSAELAREDNGRWQRKHVWADGGISDRERELVIEAARARGIEAGSTADRQLAN